MRGVCWAIVILQTACWQERYWVKPNELTQARIQRSDVNALPYENERPQKVPARLLLELELAPRHDGRILVADWRARLHNRKAAFFVWGALLFAVGGVALGMGIDAEENVQPCTFNCPDPGLDKAAPILITGGFLSLAGGIWLTIAGDGLRVPR